MSKKSKNLLLLLFSGIVIISGVLLLVKITSEPGKLDNFAQCLKDKRLSEKAGCTLP